MSRHSKATDWYGAIVLALATLLLGLIASKFILHPLDAAGVSRLAATGPVGATNLRAGFGGFALACAASLAACLTWREYRRAGLRFLALLLGIVLAVRMLGIALDHTFGDSLRVLVPESVLFVLALSAIIVSRHPGPHTPAPEMEP